MPVTVNRRHHRRTTHLLSFTAAQLIALSLLGCAGGEAKPVQPVDPGPGPGDPVSTGPEALPPFVFEARPHEPRRHTVWTSPPPLDTLPRMETSKRCWSPGRRPVDDVGIAGGGHAKKKHTTRPKKKAPKAYTVRPYQPAGEAEATPAGAASTGSGPTAAANDAPAMRRPVDTESSRSRGGAPGGVVGGASLGDDADRKEAPPASAPRADFGSADEAAAPAEPTRGGDRARRRANRDRKRKDEAPAPSSEAAGAPEPAPATATDESLRDDPYGDTTQIATGPVWPPAAEGWGDATFLSNDDSMSLSSAQRVIYAIENYLPLPREHVRPHELLNYFSFHTAPVSEDHDFSVHGEIAAEPDERGLHTLALSIAGRPVTRASRRNVNLTLVVDRSGSMREEGRMDYLKRGLLDMVGQLKDGDVISLVSFDQRLCAPIKHFVVGRDDPGKLTKAIHDLRPRGNTNLHAGLQEGYRIADAAYRDDYSNRVLLITDALANTGVTDASTMSLVSDYYDSRRIRLSGIGVGREFNDHLLDQLTEKGRGAYVFLGSPAEVDAVFGGRFISLIETVANDVHFRLHLPPTMRLAQFHGEEASTRREDVQAIHYFANTSQLFLSDIEAWQGELRPEDTIMLEVDYEHAERGEGLVEEFVIPVGELLERDDNVRKANLIMDWIGGVRALAYLATPGGWRAEPAGWADPYGAQLCGDGRKALHGDAAPLAADPEVKNVLRLWDVVCARYGQPRRPTRRNESGWPGAAGR